MLYNCLLLIQLSTYQIVSAIVINWVDVKSSDHHALQLFIASSTVHV